MEIVDNTVIVKGKLFMEYTNRNILNAFLNTFSLKKIVLGKAYINENRLHVFGLMLLPVHKKDTTAHEMYKKALYNFWSGCGDDKDYQFVLSARKKLLARNSR